MKIEIKTVEIYKGLVKKIKYQQVQLHVELTQEERSIIEEHNLHYWTVMERPPHANDEKKTETVYLDYNTLLSGYDNYIVHNPNSAKGYIVNLVEKLKEAKEFLNSNATAPQTVTLEL